MNLGLRKKIYLGFFALLLIQGLVIFLWFSHAMKQSVLDEIKNRGVSIGSSLAVGIVEPMLAMDFLRMKVLVDDTVNIGHDIFYTFVLDKNDIPLVHTFTNGFPIDLKNVNPLKAAAGYSLKLLDTGNQQVYDYAVPIMIKGDLLGTLRLGLSQTRAEKMVNQILVSTIIIIILAIVLAGVVGSFLVNPVTRSIRKLQESSEQALRGNLNVHTAPTLPKNCWDIMKCHRHECPAYKNYHHRCWYMAGTLCPTCVEGEYAKKIESCRHCRVYKKCSGDELQSLAESFDAMTLSLRGNLSDLKDAEKVLNDQRVRLRTILDAIPDFISLQDHEGRYVSVNTAFCDMLRKSHDDIVGRFNEDLFPGENARLYNQEDRHVLSSGTPMVKEKRVIRDSGVRWLHVLKIAVSETQDRPKGLVCSGRDITQLKNVQDQLTHAQKMESVGRLAAGVAHEINTPLGIILGYSQLLLEDVEKKSQVYEDVETIVKQTKICSRIVKDLLSFSRTGESVITAFDMNQALEDVIGVVEHTFSLNHVKILRSYNEGEMILEGDQEKVKQVFINLLNNAYDAIGKHGTIYVSTGFRKSGKEIVVSMTDTGCGMDKEEIRKIFEPFYTTKGPDKGTGLGLSVTFAIVEEHGGRIKVYSPPPPKFHKPLVQGTQFVVFLPVRSESEKGA